MILDWAPAHFPRDAWAMGRFDGAPLYEHAHPLRGEHRQWNTFIFDYGKPEVRNFLVASALTWLEDFHVDGLRVDAVASMLYLDYGTDDPAAWEPNEFGGRENLEAVAFVRELCQTVHERAPYEILFAQETTSWPGVTRPTYVGGLGFDFKWNMGWMHDTLDYASLDPIHRAYHHRLVTFGIMYAWSERFLLPLSHDEVVHLKKSLLSKMPGDRWKMHATLRATYGYMWAHPGKKLLFMGGEIGVWREWCEKRELDWPRLQEPDLAGLPRWVADINALYRAEPALFEVDDDPPRASNGSTRTTPSSERRVVRCASRSRRLTPPPQPRARRRPPCARAAEGQACRLRRELHADPALRLPPRRAARVPRTSSALNSDAPAYGGSGLGNLGGVDFEPVPAHGFSQSIVLTLPPLSASYFVPALATTIRRPLAWSPWRRFAPAAAAEREPPA